MSSEPTNPDREAEKTARETEPAAAQQSRVSERNEASKSSKSSESPHQFAQAVSASMSANILTVQHDKLSQGLNPNETTVSIACEVAGEEHGKAVMDALKNHGYTILMD